MSAPTSGSSLKILVWQDKSGDSWVGYYDAYWIVLRHGAAIGGDLL